MKTQNKFNRAIATFFLLIFFPTLVPTSLYASNNGPKSPEASSFEPIDATDMVNLITGQYSYVLPLLNVPSPEGGYPISLGYHAGIAMDQESSWAGLGWNVNPGAIDRNVNGYPDDYKSSIINEYYYDKGRSDYASYISTGYSLGLASVGLGFNWGSNQSLGGFVSMGVGYKFEGVGSVGVNSSFGFGSSSGNNSIGVTASILQHDKLGAETGGAMTFGASIGSGGKVSYSMGFDSNGTGFNVGSGNSGSISINVKFGKVDALGVSISSSGTISNVTGLGVGFDSSGGGNATSGDYMKDWSESNYSLTIPTPYGIFSLGGGKQTFKYSLSTNKNTYVSGPLNFRDGVENLTTYAWDGMGGWMPVVYGRVAMDKYEVLSGAFKSQSDVNNLTFPSYDNYIVQAQGISGSISPVLYESGALFGIDGREYDGKFKINYAIGAGLQNYYEATKFTNRPEFYFGNEISSYNGYADTGIAQFNNNPLVTGGAYVYYAGGADHSYKPKRRTSNYIEYFTNEEITPTPSTGPTFNLITGEWNWINITFPSPNLADRGYLKPNVSGFDRNLMPRTGIGAFNVTAPDGKTYHYSLPVYNHEIITRSFGNIPERTQENQSYFEKRQMEPYATHWLLTAVTGPDFIDNGDGMAGDGDLGYWVSFEYGKWTDAFIWKAPYKKDHLTDEQNPSVNTWIRGRKQLYYLDKIKTRTHTALFVKSERTDASSEGFSYKSVDHLSGNQGSYQTEANYVERFYVPSQRQLRLDKIILIKNEDDNVNKLQGSHSSVDIDYNRGYGLVLVNPYGENDTSRGKKENANYNCRKYVLDNQDNWSDCLPKALKVIDFNYDYSLVPGDNRLTLKNVNFKGKSGSSVIPPYKFDYINSINSFNINNMDNWGYLNNAPQTWSLNKITTPQGGTININYESNRYEPVVSQTLEFSNLDNVKYSSTYPILSSNTDVSNKRIIIHNRTSQNYGIGIGTKVKIDYCDKYCFGIFRIARYYGSGTVTSDLGLGRYEVTFDKDITLFDATTSYGAAGSCTAGNFSSSIAAGSYPSLFNIKVNVILGSGNNPLSGGGLRVSNLKVSDGLNNYITDYKYGLNEDGKGYVSYIPNLPSVLKEIPYSTELPSPRVMYEYVTMSSHKEGVLPEGKIRYKFNVLKEKSIDNKKIKFGDFYEISANNAASFTNPGGNRVETLGVTVKDNLASVGRLLEVTTLNSKGTILNKMRNDYYDVKNLPNNMGVTQESYQNYKFVDYIGVYENVQNKLQINSSTRIKYPSIIKSTSEQNNRYCNTTEFNDYDLVSGVSKEQIMTSSDGRKIKHVVVPAYLKYPQLGSKSQFVPFQYMFALISEEYYKNMLTQIAAEYSYIFENGIWKETGVGITTWSDQWRYKDIEGNDEFVQPEPDVYSSNYASEIKSYYKNRIWRKHKTYTWNGPKDNQGIFTNYNNTNDDGFNWTVGVGTPTTQPAQWKQTSEVTLYDHYSMLLEMKDINNNRAATKMGDNDTKIMASGNAGYNELFYTGGENLKNSLWLEPEVKMSGASRTSTLAHTGKYAISTTSSSQLGILMRNGQHKAGRYKMNVWVHKANAANARINYNGTSYPFNGETYNAGDWTLKTHYINNVPTTDFNVFVNSADGTTVYYDDLMLRPVASSITGYVYNEWDELSYIVSNNGLATHFEYDAAGRLVKTSVEVLDDLGNGLTGGFKLKAENKMKYKNL